MSDKLHILVVPTWYPIGYDKLMGVYHKDFTNALNKRDDAKANILFIQRHRLKKPWEYLLDKKWKEIDEGSYRTYIKTMLNVGPISPTLQLKLYTKKLEKAFKKYIKINGKPDILHAQVIIPAGYACSYIGKKYNIPVITTEHMSDTPRRRLLTMPYAPFSKFTVENSMYTAVSQSVIDIIGDAASGIRLLPNSVDLEIFSNKTPKEPNNFIDIVTVCGLRPDKGIDTEIKALKILKDKYGVKNFHLNIAGDGEYEDLYKKCSFDNEMDEYISFVGRKNREEVSELISKSDLLIMPSYEETFGIPPIEAMACGVPVVCTRCGGPDMYMDEKCGEVCNIKDEEGLSDAIYKAIKRIGTYDREYLRSVSNRFSEKMITDKAMEYYMELLNR